MRGNRNVFPVTIPTLYFFEKNEKSLKVPGERSAPMVDLFYYRDFKVLQWEFTKPKIKALVTADSKKC